MSVFGRLARRGLVVAGALLLAPAAMAQLKIPDEPPAEFNVEVSEEAARALRRAIAQPNQSENSDETGEQIPFTNPSPSPAPAPVVREIEYGDLLYAAIYGGTVDASAAAPAIELFTVEFVQTYSDKCSDWRMPFYPRVQVLSPVPAGASDIWVTGSMRRTFERYRSRVDATRRQASLGPVSMENLRESIAVMEQFLDSNGCEGESTERLYENLHRLAHGYRLLGLLDPVMHLYGPIENPDGLYRVSKLGISKLSAEGPNLDGSYTVTEMELQRGLFGGQRSTLSAQGRWYPDRQQMQSRFRYEGGCDNWTEPLWEGPLEPKSLGFNGVSAWGASASAAMKRYCVVARIDQNSCRVVGCRRWSDQEGGPSAVFLKTYQDAYWAYENYFGQ